MNKKKLILFDFDGTIADSLQENFKIANKLAARFGVRTAKISEIEELRGMSAREIIRHFKIPFYKLPFIVKAYYEDRSTIVPAIVEGIHPALKALKDRGYVLSIVSSNSEERIQTFLDKYKIEEFDSIRSEKNFFGKDKAIKKEIAKFDVHPADAIYVGDEVRDIEAARKAGIKIISGTWGFNNRFLLEKNKPDHIIDKPLELLKVIS